MLRRENITGIVLAGGQSRRMGEHKGLINLGNRNFIEHIISALQPVAGRIIVVGDQVEYDDFGVERIEDIKKNAGPLAGLHSGLKATSSDYNLILSCDIPLISADVLKLLIDQFDPEYQVIQIESEGETMPLIALYHKNCLNHFAQELERGELRLRTALKGLKVKTIPLEDRLKKYVFNINTINDLKSVNHDFDD